MDVLGRDRATEAYRVCVDIDGKRIVGLVPERLMAGGLPLTGGHGAAYRWLARHAGEIEETLKRLATGHGAGKPPFDAVVLAEE